MASTSAEQEEEDYQSILQQENDVDVDDFEDGDDFLNAYPEVEIIEEPYENLEYLDSDFRGTGVPFSSGNRRRNGQNSLDIRCNVVIRDHQDDDISTDENTFHLADEHQIFQQVEGRSQSGHGRKRPRGRGQDRRRRQHLSDAQSKKEVRLVEVYMTDEDVSNELREMIMKVVDARLAAEKPDKKRKVEGNKSREEEWMDADNCTGEALFAGQDDAPQFKWSSMQDYSGKREPFQMLSTGADTDYEHAYEAFIQYWDVDMLSHIVKKTNAYAQKLASSSTKFAKDWYNTNTHEVFVLFSFWIMLGIIRMPTTKSCFTLNPLLQTYIFRKMFTSRRYNILCRAFQFTDDDIPMDHFLCHFNSRFMACYNPSQNICVDQSWLAWRGNMPFRDGIKTKTPWFGLKTYEICESATGYLWSFYLNLGSSTTHNPAAPTRMNKCTSTVLRLIQPLLNRGHTMFVDSCLNSPLLAKFLKKRNTDCVGKVSFNCDDIPPVVSLCSLNKGEFVARHSGDVVVLAYQDNDKKVTTISTYHGNSQGLAEVEPHSTPQYKPQVILDYNKNKGGVHCKDQMLEPYLLERKGAKLNMIIFKRILNWTLLNARVLLETTTDTRKGELVFRLELVEQILKNHLGQVPKPVPERKVSSTLSVTNMSQENHWPKKIEGFMKSGRRTRRRCIWCAKNEVYRRTTYVCEECEVPLCRDPCFKLYHERS